MELTNSKRVLLSASYVVNEMEEGEARRAGEEPGRGLEKLQHIRALKPRSENLQALESLIAREADQRLQPGLRQLYSLVSRIASNARETQSNASMIREAALIPVPAIERYSELIVAAHQTVGAELAHELFKKRMRTSPVGRLHLERLEMYPVGTEQGELVFTVPLSPKETVTVSHKEWATSASEYEEIVQDYFESYSERGVAEKTDFSISSENESKHSSAFNFTASVSGGYGPVSMSVTTGLNSSVEDRQAVKESLQKNREITEKASARTRKEHKVSMKLEAKRGTEDMSFRTISNPHQDRVLRIDYYRMMRKWRTDLFRYGLRLTFDIAVPNPGARFWARHKQIAGLEEKMRAPLAFDVAPSDIDDKSWQAHALSVGAIVDPPPPPELNVVFHQELGFIGSEESLKTLYAPLDFEVPPGYTLESADIRANVIPWPHGGVLFYFLDQPGPVPGNLPANQPSQVTTAAGHLKGNSGRLSVIYAYANISAASIRAYLKFKRTAQHFSAWQLHAWNQLHAAALARHNEELSRLQQERDRLWGLLTGKDTLTLRRMEREELIRQTLYWIIGPAFDATPDEVSVVIKKLAGFEEEGADLPDGWPGSAMFRSLSEVEWGIAAGFGDLVKFLHHAIEWENILFFLYPYFWGSDDLAREKFLFDHPDPLHRDFIRAGYARVVVPVRPGFEQEFTELQDGIFSGGSNSPYLTVAGEIAAFAKTNYANIPPANPEQHARPLLYPEQRKTWETMQKAILGLENHFKTNGSYPPSLAGLPGAPFKDSWGRDLAYTVPGGGNDYDLVSYGADGQPGGKDKNADISAAAGASLVASWFEYTPTSGIDIEMVSKLAVV